MNPREMDRKPIVAHIIDTGSTLVLLIQVE